MRKIDMIVIRYPSARILGHRDLPGVRKNCPCYDVRANLIAGRPLQGLQNPALIRGSPLQGMQNPD